MEDNEELSTVNMLVQAMLNVTLEGCHSMEIEEPGTSFQISAQKPLERKGIHSLDGNYEINDSESDISLHLEDGEEANMNKKV